MLSLQLVILLLYSQTKKQKMCILNFINREKFFMDLDSGQK